MRTLLSVTLAGILGSTVALAGPAGSIEGFTDASPDRLHKRHSIATLKGPGPTDAEVGDSHSFGDEVLYLGVEQTESVTLQPDCSSFPPDSGVCIELPVDRSQTTTIDEADLGSIQLPGDVSDSLLCFTVTNFTQWEWRNTTGTMETARMTANMTVQIENDSLIGLTNGSGVPFNGLLFPDGPLPLSTYHEIRSLGAGEFQFKFPGRTRTCTGGIVNYNNLEAEGLTDKQIKDFFKEPMTVTFGMRGSVSSVSSAFFSYGVRLYGDK